uniref:MPN domain-containing protein n=1 Tax=Strigamia maritima TaxID=126957 RepID=T1J5K2_STRMM
MASEDSPMEANDETETNSDVDGEECEDEDDEPAIGRRGRRTGRGVNLSMLLLDGVLQPGEGALTIDYLGKKFVGDLLSNGKIRWQDTRQLFNSPSAWAIYCKKVINPEKKSGCGWASVKYDGRKLDYYKSLWYKKHRALCISKEVEPKNGHLHVKKEIKNWNLDDNHMRRPVIAHNLLGIKSSEQFSIDPNTLVQCTTFSALGKMQPFTVTVSNNCLLLMDFHSHLTTSEVVGYLGGMWDITAHNLTIMQAFPCKCRLADKENAPIVEEMVRYTLQHLNLALVGWYHSHPASPPEPTLRDITCQMEYQIKLKGGNDAAYTPCLAMICSPYEQINGSESNIQAFWVMPPPENKPLEYGKPMLMTYTGNQELPFTTELALEMNHLRDYYKSAPDAINFEKEWSKDGTTYLEKLQHSLSLKLPADTTEVQMNEIMDKLFA